MKLRRLAFTLPRNVPLMGGPLDGQTVEVLGSRHVQTVPLPRAKNLIAEAVYHWDYVPRQRRRWSLLRLLHQWPPREQRR
jgi:hypothetical protein